MSNRKPTRKKLDDVAELQHRYYVAIRHAAERRRAQETKSFIRIMMVVMPVAILLAVWAILANREPEMYISERECIQEGTEVGSFVGVSPNPLDWKIDGKTCTKYGETTLRLNPDYLIWVQREQAEAEEQASWEASYEDDTYVDEEY